MILIMYGPVPRQRVLHFHRAISSYRSNHLKVTDYAKQLLFYAQKQVGYYPNH